MLAWTPAGAVARPRALQVRLEPAWPGRVRAGAPSPSRALTTAEVEANLRWFTTDSPRGLPIVSLVLAGQGATARADLPGLVALARRLGVRRVTLHAGADDLGPVLGVDRYVFPVHSREDAQRVVAVSGLVVDVNIPLSTTAVPILEDLVAAVGRHAASVTLTFPFPGAELPLPAISDAVAAIARARVRFGERSFVVKGLPACWLGSGHSLVQKSGNRWYVDAEHQRDRALIFFPGVVAFAKEDGCRFCAADGACDGFLPARSLPDDPPLTPLEP